MRKIVLILAAGAVWLAGGVEVVVLSSGEAEVRGGGGTALMRPYASLSEWWAAYGMADKGYGVEPARFHTSRRGMRVKGEARRVGERGVNWTFDFPARGEEKLECGLECIIPFSRSRGFWWRADGKGGSKKNMLRNASVSSLMVADKGDTIFDLKFSKPVQVQMFMRWETVVVRIGRAPGAAKEAGRVEVGVEFAAKEGVKVRVQPGIRLAEKEGEWARFEPGLEIEPGSALDFSGLRNVEGPCGKHGRVIVNGRGEFAFEKKPEVRVKFNGVNLCFSALFTERAQTDALLDRLVRLGFNSVRVHHYEPDMVTPWRATGFNWNAENVDRLHYFVAGCSKRGIYLTTDLYVFRAVAWRQIGRERDGECDNALYKLLVPGDEGALADFRKFAKEAFGAKSRYTGKRLCDDPAWATVCLINEPHVPSLQVKDSPGWQAKWKKFLEEKHPGLKHLRFGDMRSGEAMRLGRQFHAWVEAEFAEGMKKFLAEELGWKIPVTDMNVADCGTTPEMHGARLKALDFVDMHYYADHPVGIGVDPFGLPNTSSGIEPAFGGAEEIAKIGANRIFGRPFTASEWNWCAPSPHRAAGSLLFAAFAGAQGWDGLWRFSYDNRAEGMFDAKPAKFFYLSADPLMLAAERFTHFFFTLGDVGEMERRVAVEAKAEELMDWGPGSRTPWSASFKYLPVAAYAGRIGMKAAGEAAEPGEVTIPFSKCGDLAWCRGALKAAGMGCFDNLDDRRIESGYLKTDGKTGGMTIDAEKAAGFYAAEAGMRLKAEKAGVETWGATCPATVAVASLDRKALRESRRMLLGHMTDLKNTGQVFTDPGLKTMNELGGLPYLVKVGKAGVRVKTEVGGEWRCYALGASGKRLGEVGAKVTEAGGEKFVEVELSTDGGRFGTAVMLYELERAGE